MDQDRPLIAVEADRERLCDHLAGRLGSAGLRPRGVPGGAGLAAVLVLGEGERERDVGLRVAVRVDVDPVDRAGVELRAAETRERGTAIASACAGTFVLAESGILDGQRATTTWWLSPAFRNRYPAVQLEQDHMVIASDGITTAGAAFGHVDLALAIVRNSSPALAKLVARYLVLDERPSQSAYIIPSALAQSDPTVAAFERWTRARLAEPISIPNAAKSIGVSERTLQRCVQRTLGTSPIRFVQDLRIERASHLLRTTGLSLEPSPGKSVTSTPTRCGCSCANGPVKSRRLFAASEAIAPFARGEERSACRRDPRRTSGVSSRHGDDGAGWHLGRYGRRDAQARGCASRRAGVAGESLASVAAAAGARRVAHLGAVPRG
jgi:AraC-like DNA-binding protein